MPPVKLCPKCKKNPRRGGSGSYCTECAEEMMERKVRELHKLNQAIIKAKKKPLEDLGLSVQFADEESDEDFEKEMERINKMKGEKQTKL